MTDRPDYLDRHEQEVTRLRRLLATATTPALKARLIEEIEKHEQIVLAQAEREPEETA